MDKGLITPTILVILGLASILVVGGGFGAYKYSELQKEKMALRIEFQDQNAQEVERLEKELNELRSELATTTQNKDDVGTSTEGTEQKQVDEEVVKEVTKYVPVEIPVEQDDSSETEFVKNTTELKVTNVKENTDEEAGAVKITWETNVESDSRVIIDGDQFFASENPDSKAHSVVIDGLLPSKTYDYEIVAERGLNTDSHFGKFSMPREFVVTFEKADKDGCTYVVIKDTEGKPLWGAEIKLSGYYSGPGTNFVADTVIDKTDSKGKILYCDKIEDFKVQNLDTGEVYYNEKL